MQQTTNYNLNKFDSTDELESATRLGLNENADTIDTALKGIQDDIDGLDASDVSYDNTVSGLTATDVQAALDEELDKIDILSNSVSALADYSTTDEQVIGTYGGKPLYRKVLTGRTASAVNTWQVMGNVGASIGVRVDVSARFTNGSWTGEIPYIEGSRTLSIVVYDNGDVSTNTNAAALVNLPLFVVVTYTKSTD